MNDQKIAQLQRFFWPPVENDDYLEAASYRALMMFSLAGFMISIWIVARYLFASSTQLTFLSEVVLFSFPIFLLFPYFLARKVPIATIGRLFTIYTVVRLSVLAVSFGGIDSTQSLMLIPVVLIATFVLGAREGIVGLFATFLIYLGLFFSQRSTLSSPVELFELREHFIQLVAVLVMVAGASVTFRHQLVKAVEDLVDAKANADASNLAKSEFLANMSHEIRTPMNGVLGMADVLKNTQLTPKQEMLVQTIDRSGSALLKIINDILDFSKIEADKMELESEPVDIREIVNDVSSLLRTSASEKGIELRTKCANDVPGIVRGDGGRIRQVLVNLVGNAIKFTDEGFVLIDVEATKTQGTAQISFRVTDTGIGIPPENMDGIFDKFAQVDGSTTRRYGGTGLGLAIAQSLVKAMNGHMKLTSEVGEGSTFQFELDLPILTEHAKPFTPSLHNETKVPALVIVGNIENRKRIVKAMAKWGVRTVSAASGQKALRAISKIAATKFQFPLVVLDNQLTGVRSYQIMERLNQTGTKQATPVIFVRSEGISEREDTFMLAKADTSLESDFAEGDLKQATYDLILGNTSPVEKRDAA